ncbi:tRNA dihydrouridine synthase DusB [Ereboglobus luteus]|uniref:tRNA-dihydrouridine synthase n=1 Tax=Ereboglobus luteus TaxID=1796921 RepID=A0A2U8E2A9_9BACT|nr:tRNA dihydrouridine synthase DusB [Ereboglobus luteus]AWI08971.1 tRNA dihydrouridine synthase DusB [Ereboglobus luteus]
MRIGSVQIDSPLFLSPLAGYTNLPMRLTIRELGGLGWATTDLVNARSLIERNPKALQLIRSTPADRPMAIQLFGSDPAEMRDAAVICEQSGAASIDINMGCPVPKVVKVGGGSAMMTELDKTAKLARGMVEAVKIPVTAKMRLGWDDANITAPDLARVLEDSGIAAVFVHGRTRAQGFSGTVNLAGIRKVAEAVKTIPVIGNGDVITPESARKMIDETGCAGVSIGRGAFYDPWIFRRTEHLLRTGELLPEPTFAERVRVMSRHLDLMIEVFGEELGCRMFRKIAPWYARRLGPSKDFKQRIVKMNTRADFETILVAYRKWRAPFCENGNPDAEPLPRFRPAPLVASFMRPAGETTDAGESIPVPKGPVDFW